jgi:hypothetical protein
VPAHPVSVAQGIARQVVLIQNQKKLTFRGALHVTTALVPAKREGLAIGPLGKKQKKISIAYMWTNRSDPFL